MIEIGEIKKLNLGGWCTVKFPRKTACENCRMCLMPKEEMFVELKLPNSLGAKVGDSVSVSMGDRAVVTASLIVYLIPLSLLAAALGVASLAHNLAVSLGAAGGALIVGFGIVKLIDKKLKTKKDYAPRMLAILKDKKDAKQAQTVIEDVKNDVKEDVKEDVEIEESKGEPSK